MPTLMFSYVIDTNILMSILISGKAQYLKLLSYSNFIVPQFLLTELDEYKEVIENKTKLNKDQLRIYIYNVFSMITVIPSFAITKNSISQAKALCEKIDIKDISFVAQAIDMNLTLLTRDEPLYKGLKKQKFRNVELFDIFLKKLIK